MKRKLLSIVTCLAMLMSLLPIGIQPAQAVNNEIIVGGVKLTGSLVDYGFAITDDSGKVTTSGADANHWNIRWDGDYLYLRNATITSAVISKDDHVSACVYADQGYRVRLEGNNKLYPVNTEMSTANYNGYVYNYGFYAKNGDVYIYSFEATSQLEYDNTHADAFVAGPGSPQRVVNAAVYVENGNVTIQDCTLDLTGGKSSVHKDAVISSNISLESYGIYADGSVNITRGTVTAIGGETANNSQNTPYTTEISVGIFAKEGVNIEPINNKSITYSIGSSASDIDTTKTVTYKDGVQSIDTNSAKYFYSEEADYIAVDSVKLNASSLNLEIGAERQLEAEISPDNATVQTVSWSSNKPNIATVDANGKITAKGSGTSMITATVDGKTADCQVTVSTPVTGVTLDKTEMTLTTGQTGQLKATVEPDDASNKDVEWSSSDPEVATVNGGEVTAVGPGTATITVTTEDGNKTASCTVTVTQLVTGVKLDQTEMTLVVGETGTLNATVEPENASNTNVVWSSDNAEVATVDDGLVTAVGPGTATITVTATDGSGVSASCTVKVIQPVTGVTLDQTEMTLVVGETGTLKATVEPENASNKNVVWSSENADVATVNDGEVTAVGPGTATITVTTEDGKKTANCTVRVSQPVTSVTLDQTEMTLVVGETGTLNATVKPENASNKDVEWTSSDEKVATVKEGKVTAIGFGTATITATATDGSDVSDSCKVIVHDLATGVTLDQTEMTLVTGDTATLQAKIEPVTASTNGVTWSTSDEHVAKVEYVKLTFDEEYRPVYEGKVTAVEPGTAVITATVNDGSGKSVSCTVTVPEPTAIGTHPQSITVTEGQQATFSVAATGNGLSYQWQQRTDGTDWENVDGATNATYTIDRTTTDMSGYQYRCIVTGLGGEVISNAATLTVNERPYTGKYSYEIVSDVGENGTIDVDRYATEGDQVTITVSPDEAYLLDDLTVTSGGKDVELADNGDGSYSFTMPSGDVAITATFAEDPNWEEPEDPATDVSEIFTDVPANHWAQAVIQYVYDNGLMTGTSATMFEPNTSTTRAMIVAMLARLEGITSAESAGFSDVSGSDWYATAVNWAASEGIVGGFGDSTFQPNSPITREQMASILYRYAEYKGYDVSARADLSAYSDQPSVWAEEVLSWAVAEGLLNGVTDDELQPQGQATRAQVAAILQRFLSE